MSISLNAYALCDLDTAKRNIRPEPSAEHDDLLRALINVATDMIERECGDRRFAATTHTAWLDGSGDSVLVLPHYPVSAVARVCTGPTEALYARCDASDASGAGIAFDGDNVVLTVEGGAAAGTTNLGVATYTTLSAMATAIAAASGSWTASVLAGLENVPSSHLRPDGRWNCHEVLAALNAPGDPLSDFQVDYDAGLLIVHGTFPRGARNIHVEYTAGYSTIPEALQQACADLAARMYHRSARDTSVASESLGDYRWQAGGELIDNDLRMRLAPFTEFAP